MHTEFVRFMESPIRLFRIHWDHERSARSESRLQPVWATRRPPKGGTPNQPRVMENPHCLRRGPVEPTILQLLLVCKDALWTKLMRVKRTSTILLCVAILGRVSAAETSDSNLTVEKR